MTWTGLMNYKDRRLITINYEDRDQTNYKAMDKREKKVSTLDI